MNILKIPTSSVVPWDKNPRGIKTKDFERLKKQILKLGVYKPLVCYRENGKFVVLGGNMRIRALKDLGLKEVEVSVVEPKTEAQKIEFALSDNDRAGYYDEDQLAELVYPYLDEITLEDFKVDLGQPLNLAELVEQVGPDRGAPIYVGKAEIPDPPADQLEFVGKFENVCVEFSGGKDSLLALLWARKTCEALGKTFGARFVETGAEFPCLSSYVRRLCMDQGINLRVLAPKESILTHYIDRGKWPDPIFRDCQHKFINDVLDAGTKSEPATTLKIRGGRPEQKVMKTPKAAYVVTSSGYHLYAPYFDLPLAEYQELLKTVEPFRWPGYSKGFRRTACWMCPFQTPEQWEAMRGHYPLLWEEMRVLAMRLKYPRHAGDSTIKRFGRYWNKFR